MTAVPDVRVGVVGTGFLSSHLVRRLASTDGMQVSRVLTRRDPASCHAFPASDRLTTSIDELLDTSDAIVECSGHTLWACDVIDAAVQARRPVVTMNSAFHIVAGSHYVGRGAISEAEGDQPGSEVALARDVVEMGFNPLAFGSMKGYLNKNPSEEDMRYWSQRQGISLQMVTSFTDGTKLHIEQALVGNAMGATVAPNGMIGPDGGDMESAARTLADAARAAGVPVTDYMLSPRLSHGVFVIAEHDQVHAAALRYYKAGAGPEYIIAKPTIYGHLETPRTIRQLLQGEILLDNTATPTLSVNTIAKRALPAGHRLPYGVGSFDVRGEVVRIDEHPGHLPIALVYEATLRRSCEAGETLAMSDVDMPESRAMRAWIGTEEAVLRGR